MTTKAMEIDGKLGFDPRCPQNPWTDGHKIWRGWWRMT